MYYHVDLPPAAPEPKAHSHRGFFIFLSMVMFIVGVGSGGVVVYLAMNSQNIAATVSNLKAKEPRNTVAPPNLGSLGTEYAANALVMSRNLKRKSDLSMIASAVNMYVMDSDGEALSVLPRVLRKIGTGKGLFNLALYLVPTYLETFPVDPEFGTQADTGYAIFLNSDEQIVVQATSEDDPSTPIEVVR